MQEENNDSAKVSLMCREVAVAFMNWLYNKEGKTYKERQNNDPVANAGNGTKN